MGTEYNLRCISHHPPIESAQVAHSSIGLDQIRKDVANRNDMVLIWNAVDSFEPFDERLRNNTAQFLASHPNCSLDLIDDYGRNHALIEEPEVEMEETKAKPVWEGHGASSELLGRGEWFTAEDGTEGYRVTDLTEYGKKFFGVTE